MKTFAKALLERKINGFVLIEVILCGSSVYWRYSGESTVYLYKHECEYAKHQDPSLFLNFKYLKLISYELL